VYLHATQELASARRGVLPPLRGTRSGGGWISFKTAGQLQKSAPGEAKDATS